MDNVICQLIVHPNETMILATRKETANRHLSDAVRFPMSEMVGDTGIEPVTSCVSCKRANQLRQSPECS